MSKGDIAAKSVRDRIGRSTRRSVRVRRMSRRIKEEKLGNRLNRRKKMLKEI